eukprot:m.43559 g.43559  ORF g.43559 m.43559 type:complete len:1290 (-) comp7117_c0_seq1:32-3901(-)
MPSLNVVVAIVFFVVGGWMSTSAKSQSAICRVIDDNCAECSGSTCTKCLNPLLLFGNTCVVSCDIPGDQAYYALEGKECLPCHSSCAGCFGSSSSNCIKCKPSAGVLYLASCISECPISTYETGLDTDVSGIRCESCATDCGRCNATSCLACEQGFYLQGTACVRAQDCVLGSGAVEGSLDGLGGVCVDCIGADCERCSSGNEDGCTLCGNLKVLQEGKCVDSCDNQHAFHPSKNQCRLCSEFIADCSTCSVDGTSCTACDDGFHYENGECKLSTVCNAFEQATVEETPTSDRVCVACTLCSGTDMYSLSGCESRQSSTQCFECASICTSPYTILSGLCGPLTTAACKRPQATDYPNDGRAFVDVRLHISGLSGVVAMLDEGVDVMGTMVAVGDVIVDGVLVAVPYLAANPSRSVGSLAASAISEGDLAITIRASVAASELATTVTFLEALATSAEDAFIAALPIAFNASSVFVLDTSYQVTDVTVTGLRITNTTSHSLTIAWTEVKADQSIFTLSDALPMYVVYVARSDGSNKVSLITSALLLDIPSSITGPGVVSLSVGIVSPTSGEIGPMTQASSSVPICGENCNVCSMSQCLSCNSTSTSPMKPSSLDDRACVSASTANGPCVTVGQDAQLCGTSMILAILGVVVLMFVIIFLVYCLCTRNRVKMNKDTDNWNQYRIKLVKHVPKWTLFPDMQKAALNQSRPLTGVQLQALTSEGMNVIDEFASVPTNAASLEDVLQPEMEKNRFVTILPNIHTRVVLSTKSHSSVGSGFINANFVRGFDGSERRYVLTQAPLPDTVEDLLHMVWDQRISTIVMLCRLVEDGTIVCPRYFPTRTKWHQVAAPTNDGDVTSKTRRLVFGRFSLQLTKEVESDVFTISKFKLRNGSLGSRTLSHISYHLWPHTAQTPPPNGFVSLIEAVNSLRRNDGSPLLVHCTSGADRAAAFVLCDMAINMYKATRRVDLLKLLCNLRQDKGCTISSVDLYKFVYRVCASFTGLFGNYRKGSEDMVVNPVFNRNLIEEDDLSDDDFASGDENSVENAYEAEMSLSSGEEGEENNNKTKLGRKDEAGWATILDKGNVEREKKLKKKKGKSKVDKKAKKEAKKKKKEEKKAKRHKRIKALLARQKKQILDEQAGYLSLSSSSDSLSDMNVGIGGDQLADSSSEEGDDSDNEFEGDAQHRGHFGAEGSVDSQSEGDEDLGIEQGWNGRHAVVQGDADLGGYGSMDSDSDDGGDIGAHVVMPVFENGGVHKHDMGDTSSDDLSDYNHADDDNTSFVKSRIINAILSKNQ